MTADTPPPAIPLERACDPQLLCTVIHETARAGWPHRSTRAERVEITSRVMRLRLEGPGTVVCRFGPTLGRGFCGVRPTGQRAFRVNYRVYEDGSLVSWRNLKGE